MFLRAAVVLFCAGFAFFLVLFFMRRMRKQITDECEVPDGAALSLDTLPLHLYNTVIQQLKQQKHELLVQSQAEQKRARTSENFSHAVLANLSCGVLVFGANGLVRTANPAAKAILGFGSTTGMSAEDMFRGAEVYSAKSLDGVFSDETVEQAIGIAAEIHTVLREGIKRRQVEADYKTPAGEKRYLSMAISQVPASDGTLLGVTCLINDLTELENIRRQQELQGEISAEMALQLRTSLTTISGYAQQLANNRDPEMAKEIATDIAHEAAQLDRTIGGFLTTKPKASGSSVGSK
ncbi:MAG TPA: PAS domain-containing protein [Candidatus Sulfotelmatobacter sp.]|nr:PAS domain-containing protein [Candidatus Sulfotelmatobacter sp.]